MVVDSESVLGIAKTSIDMKVLSNEDWMPNLSEERYSDFRENQGSFTTIYNQDHSLRGCIGLPYPNQPLGNAIAISARNAATRDPRFVKLDKSELGDIIIEVEALSPIEQIQFQDENDLISQIEVGMHGLLVKYGLQGGLLLPKVGERYDWDSLDLIQHTCQKAGLPKNAYTYSGIEFFKFTSVLYKANN